jgi:hypothetical protein
METVHNIVGMFATFERCPSTETEANKIFLIIHLRTLQEQFPLYCKDVDILIFELLEHPFVTSSISGPLNVIHMTFSRKI